MRFRPRVFTVRPWEASFGDPAPTEVLGARVSRLVLVRVDRPGAVVQLVNGAFAVTGEVLVCGAHRDVSTYLRRRARHSQGLERAWLRDCRQAVASERARQAAPPSS